MRPFGRVLLGAAVFAVSSYMHVPSAVAGEPVEEVRRALDELDGWLGTGVNGDRWRDFLKSDQLRAQLSKGPDADPKVLDEVVGQYLGEAEGLDLPRFVAVREAIDAWRAKLTAPEPEQLVEAARSGSARFVPTTSADVRRSRRRLRAATRELNRFLRRIGDNGQRWRRFLRQDDLEAQLAADEANWRTLREIADRYSSGYRGLEMPVFSRVTDALRSHLEMLRTRQNRQASEEFQQAIDVLVANLEAALADPHGDNLDRLARTIGWFDDRGQLRPIVEGTRRHFSHPNLFVQVSGDFIGKMQQQVDVTGPVRDVILGTSIRGTGRTTGQVSLQLVPNDRHAAFDAVFVGANRSRTTGYNGPAVIRSRGLTRITARKRILMDEDGIYALGTDADAQTSTRTTGVSTNVRIPFRRLADRIATRKVCEQKRNGERVAARHAEEQFCERMDEQTAELVVKGNDAYFGKFRQPLVKRDQFPRQLSFRTSADHLFVSAVAANRYQFGAQSAAPQVEGDADIVLRVHESAANNTFFGMLSGVHVENEDVKAQLLNTFGTLPERFQEEEGRDPWSITFAEEKPITVEFDDGQFAVTFRGDRYTSGRRSFPTGMDVSVRYAMELTERGLKGTRQGDVGATPPGWDGQRRFSLREQTLRRMVQRRFGKIFQEEIILEDIELPEGSAGAGRLQPVQYYSEDGWLMLGLRHISEAEAVALNGSRERTASSSDYASNLFAGVLAVWLDSLTF